MKNYKEQFDNAITDAVLVNSLLNKDDIYDYISISEDEEIYQVYIVEVKPHITDEEKAKLGIVYYEPLDVYIVPVTHYGISWEDVPAVDLSI